MRLHNFTKPALAAVLACVLALTGCQNSDENQESTSDQAASAADQGNTPSDADTSEGNTMTSLEVIREMGNGINLGNTLEAYNHQAYLSGSSPTLAVIKASTFGVFSSQGPPK